MYGKICPYTSPRVTKFCFLSCFSITDNLSSLDALMEALDNLDKLCETIGDAYQQSLATNDYEKFTERQ